MRRYPQYQFICHSMHIPDRRLYIIYGVKTPSLCNRTMASLPEFIRTPPWTDQKARKPMYPTIRRRHEQNVPLVYCSRSIHNKCLRVLMFSRTSLFQSCLLLDPNTYASLSSPRSSCCSGAVSTCFALNWCQQLQQSLALAIPSFSSSSKRFGLIDQLT